jgi:hypothetical protein
MRSISATSRSMSVSMSVSISVNVRVSVVSVSVSSQCRRQCQCQCQCRVSVSVSVSVSAASVSSQSVSVSVSISVSDSVSVSFNVFASAQIAKQGQCGTVRREEDSQVSGAVSLRLLYRTVPYHTVPSTTTETDRLQLTTSATQCRQTDSCCAVKHE